MNEKRERRNFWFFAVGFSVALGLAVLIPNPTITQQWAFRGFASIMGAGIGANIPGFLSVNWRSHFGKKVDTTIKATGAMAIFVIVYLVNPPALLSADSFALTVRATSKAEPNVTHGKARVQIGEYNHEESFDTNGDATFKDVPHKYFGRDARVLPEVDGYTQDAITVNIDKPVITIRLQVPQTHMEGQIIFPRTIPRKDIRVFANGAEGPIDADGKFDIPLQVTGTVDVEVRIRNKVVYARGHEIPGPVTITID